MNRKAASKINPLIGSSDPRDTMDNVANILECIEGLMLGQGATGQGVELTQNAKSGFMYLNDVMATALRYESGAIHE